MVYGQVEKALGLKQGEDDSMRMLVKCSVLALSAVGFLMAQHGGGGHHGGGGSGGGGFHASAPARSASPGFHSGYQTSITPPSYSGHLTLSTPSPYVGSYNRAPIVSGRPVWTRPPIRRPGRYPYYGGVGLYPFVGYGYGLGYYGDNYLGNDYYGNGGYDAAPYYAPQEQPQYQPNYDAGPEPYAGYPPVPYAADPNQQQQPMSDPAPPPSSPITVVLKNGQKLEVQNYAIMNGFFWDFTRANSKHIPVGDVDVAASVKATEAAGGTFPEEAFGVVAQ